MADSNNESLLVFPCEYPIKVMGKSELQFEAVVVAIFRKHVPDLGEAAITTRQSKDGNFVSITVTFTATSRAQLDGLYQELHAHNDVMMVL